MKKQIILTLLLISVTFKIFGQLKVGINPTNITSGVHLEVQAVDSSRFVILRTNGRIGVGTISPTEKMDIVGNLKFSGAFMPANSAGSAGQVLVSGGAGAAPTWLTMSATNTPNIYSADGTLAGNRVVTQGSNTLRFDGTAATGGSALFSNGTGSNLTLAAKSTTGQATLQATAGSTSLNYVVNGGAATQITSTGGTSLDIGNTNAVNLNFLTNNATRMTVSSTGNVGIGTTTPGNLLNVYNNTNASIGDNFPMVNVFSNNTSNNTISVGSGLSGATLVGIHGSAGVGELLQNSRYLGSPALGANIQLMTGVTTASPKALLTATSDGKIGIGTITPTYSLHVLNSTQNTRELLEVTDSTYINSLDLKSPSSQWRIIQQAYSNGNRLDIYDQKNSKNVLTLQPLTGHVGINRTNPLGQIHFGSKGSIGANQFYSGATLDGFMIDTYINTSVQNGNTYTRVADLVVGSPKTTSAGASIFRFLTNTNADAGDTLVERMRIHTNGFVGIGTSTPNAKLTVESSGTSGSTAGSQAIFRDSGSGNAIIGLQTQGIRVGWIGMDRTSSTMYWANDGTGGGNALANANMVLTSAGNVGIGLTTPSSPLHVSSSSSTSVYINNTAGDPDGNLKLNVPATNSTGTISNTEYVLFLKAGANIAKIAMNTTATGVDYVTSSDKRIKENIKPTHYSINDLMKIDVTDYNFITDKNKTQQAGFLAQDLYKIYPQAVSMGKNDELDENGLPKNPWMVDYGRLTPLIVKATQDLKKELDEKQILIDKQQLLINQLLKDVEELKAKIK